MNKSYKTKQAKAILDCLQANAGRHLTAEEIYKLLKNGQTVGLTTVYRNLEKLLKEGLVLKYETGAEACFQLLGDCKQKTHYHLVCTECGGITHSECRHLDALFEHFNDEHYFSFDKQKTVFYGKCNSCKT